MTGGNTDHYTISTLAGTRLSREDEFRLDDDCLNFAMYQPVCIDGSILGYVLFLLTLTKDCCETVKPALPTSCRPSAVVRKFTLASSPPGMSCILCALAWLRVKKTGMLRRGAPRPFMLPAQKMGHTFDTDQVGLLVCSYYTNAPTKKGQIAASVAGSPYRYKKATQVSARQA